MKILDRIILVLFSVIILIISAVMVLLMFGIINFTTIAALFAKLIASDVATNITLASSLICILFAVKAIFFGESSEKNNGINGEGILLENESGKLLISRDTIENLVNGVAKGFENTQSVTTKVIVDNKNTLKVFVTLMVLPNTVINELSMNLQKKIKGVVKEVTDLEIKSIDIKIKNITTPEENKEV